MEIIYGNYTVTKYIESLPLTEYDHEETTLESHSGSYRFNRVPFGLKNESLHFENALDIFIAARKFQTGLVKLHYISIFYRDAKYDLHHIEKRLSDFRSKIKRWN